MKKGLAALVFLLTVFFSVSAESESSGVSEYTYWNYPVYRVYQHLDGYVILYEKAGAGIGKIYMPKAWFRGKDQKAQFTGLEKRQEPYISIFYKKGEFSHAVIGMPINRAEGAWDRLPADAKIQGKFERDTITFE